MERDRVVRPTNETDRRPVRPWFVGRRPRTPASGSDGRPDVSGFDVGDTLDLAGRLDATLDVSVSIDRSDTAIVTVSGRLVRQNAAALDESLGSVFAVDHPTFVIDLTGVTRLDPTTLAAITRRAAVARGRGSLITIVPPGAGREQAA